MKKILAVALLSLSCATTRATEEQAACPADMTREQHEHGVTECRALCSSWGRNFKRYQIDCRCVCES